MSQQQQSEDNLPAHPQIPGSIAPETKLQRSKGPLKSVVFTQPQESFKLLTQKPSSVKTGIHHQPTSPSSKPPKTSNVQKSTPHAPANPPPHTTGMAIIMSPPVTAMEKNTAEEAATNVVTKTWKKRIMRPGDEVIVTPLQWTNIKRGQQRHSTIALKRKGTRKEKRISATPEEVGTSDAKKLPSEVC